MLPTSTHTRMRKLLRNALPMSAFTQATLKFSKFSQLSGSVMTLVVRYSSSVLNAVVTQLTMGTSAQNAPNRRMAY